MNKPHVHKDVIIAYANGAKIQFKEKDGAWEDVDDPSFYDDEEYRVKPEREYPVTSLSHTILCEIYFEKANHETVVNAGGLEEIANAAIKQYIIDTEQK